MGQGVWCWSELRRVQRGTCHPPDLAGCWQRRWGPPRPWAAWRQLGLPVISATNMSPNQSKMLFLGFQY